MPDTIDHICDHCGNRHGPEWVPDSPGFCKKVVATAEPEQEDVPTPIPSVPGFRLPTGPHDLGEFIEIEVEADDEDPPFDFDALQEALAANQQPVPPAAPSAPAIINPDMRAVPSRAELLVDYIRRINDLPSGSTLAEVRPIIEAAWKAGFNRVEEMSTLEGVILARKLSLIGVKADAVSGMIGNIKASDLNVRRSESDDWRDKLQRSVRDQVPIPNAYNAAVALTGVFADGIRHDSFTDKVYVRELPGGPEEVLNDHIHFKLLTTIQANGFPQARKTDVADAVHAVARQKSSNALTDKLRGLAWDGVPRVDLWLTMHCHVPDGAYIREVAKITLLQSVARAFEPGCKADHIPVLVGKQGMLKSTLWRALSYGWYLEFVGDFGNKDSLQQMRGVWFVEFAELSSMTRKEVGQVKAFLTKQEDNYRKSYGREDQRYDREFSLCGSANPLPFLKDYTGSRRFLCCTVPKRIEIAALQTTRDQLWAEAVARYQRGEKWYCDAQWFRDEQERSNEQWTELHPWFETISTYVHLGADGKETNEKRPYIRSAEEILTHVIGLKVSEQRQEHRNKVGEILVKLGYEGNRTIRAGGERFTGYKRID